jgi:hypothetical protein
MMEAKHFFYLHFHKVAGSYVAAAMEISNIRMPRRRFFRSDVSRFIYPHANGNVFKRDLSSEIIEHPDADEEIRWSMISKTEQEQRLLIEKSFHNHFIACEWDMPAISSIKSVLSDYYLFTIIRDPFERFVSNYYYDLQDPQFRSRQGLEVGASIGPSAYSELREPQCRPNFYINTIIGYNETNNSARTEEELSVAMDILGHFDAVVILEEDLIDAFLKGHGLEVPGEKRINALPIEARPALSISEDFADSFRSVNGLDYRLYEYCKSIAWRP